MRKISEKERLLAQIEQYFDCRLSDSGERQLRKSVAETNLRHPAIDEIRAVMGLRKPAAYKAAVSLRLTAAASVAVLLTLGLWFAFRPSTTAAECVAYCNGTVVTDEAQVMSLFAADVAAVAQTIEKCETEI